MSKREKWTRIFLWISVFWLGIGLGAKLFDLVVLAASWGAAPPESLKLMPYGANYPINPGTFFQPLSVIMLIGILGALICGWKTPRWYRVWLWVPVISFVLIWIAAPTVFWPMIGKLWYAGTGEVPLNQTDAMDLVRRWIICDWLRVIVVAVGFFASVKAISMPYPRGDVK